MVGRYGNNLKQQQNPKEQARRTKQNSPQVKAWLAIRDTIALEPFTISALKELASSEPKLWNNGKTYDEVIMMLINTYRQAQKSAQWRHDHPTLV